MDTLLDAVILIANKLPTYDPIQDVFGLGRAVSGGYHFVTGLGELYTLLVPDPIPIVDEAKAVWKVVYGFIKLVTGTGEFTDWDGDD